MKQEWEYAGHRACRDEIKQLQAQLIVKPAASGRSKALTRPPGHGGYREGSGRKAILDGGVKRTFVLTAAHLEQIDAWGRAHNIDNRSAALRHMIEQTMIKR